MGRKRDMLDVTHPELCEEWDYEKNAELPRKLPSEYTKGSGVKVWWKCPDCQSSYDMTVTARTSKMNKCPFCRGYRVNHTNSLASIFPDVAKEWHPSLNEKTPDDFTSKSNKSAWWLGSCGHEWEAPIDRRTESNRGCPYCSGVKVLIGFNDMWTTNPELASMLADPEDGYKHTQNSNRKLDWECSNCGNVLKKRIANNIFKRGLHCTKCSDGVSFPEKFIYNLLLSLNICFETQVSFNWSDRKLYDFYITDLSCIIEVHGEQHYLNRGMFYSEPKRTFEQEIENDKIKKYMALDNGIKNYIVIDARESSLEYLTHSVKESLGHLFNLSEVDFAQIAKESHKSILLKANELWNKGQSIGKISEELKLTNNTIVTYLKSGASLGLCDYNKQESRSRGAKKEVVQLLEDGTFVYWESIIEASSVLNISHSSIIYHCNKEYKTPRKRKWMYKEDFDQMIANQQKEIS